LQFLEVMSDKDEIINPSEWTTKELVKHLYREISEIKEEQKKMNTTLRLLEDDLTKRKWVYGVLSTAAGFVGAIIGLLIKWFNDGNG